MEVTTMRVVDRWLGTPACALLTLVRRLTDPFRRKPPDKPRRILIVKLAEQGATVLAYSSLRRAVEAVGRENVFVAVFAENRFILDLLHVIPPENVITIRTTGLGRVILDAFSAVRRCHREGIDSAVDFEFFAHASAILAYLSGASRRVGYHSFAGEGAYRGDLCTHRLVYNTRLHAVEVFRVLVEALFLPPERLPVLDLGPLEEEPAPPFEPTAEELLEVREIAKRLLDQPTQPPLILLNANTGDLLPLRRWPTERYVDLACRILERYPEVAIGLTGSPEEAAGAQRVADDIGSNRCVSFGGHTTLRQLLVLYCLSELMVTNDSGPAHYSNLTPIDVITLFGPETPSSFGSRSPRSHIFWAGIDCSPCVNAFNDRWSPCTDNVCMQRITVDQVFEKVCEVYEMRRASAAGQS
jgi:ADP-heptose:LPS heptosyltransferase